MRFNTIFFLLIGACVCLTLAQVTYDDCCLWYVKRLDSKIQKHAVTYRWQVPDGDCNIPAVVFTMRRGRVFCTDPTQKWVHDLMKKIDEKRGKAILRKPIKRRPLNRLRD